ncbi:hypothetical protein HOY80DRAFT_1111266 [Tuber brumale]|nr:hypothetical protein HOY80DRAFT_1111266 [Tuber brumale]
MRYALVPLPHTSLNPSRVDVELVPFFDYHRVLATGRFRHDQEMLIAPQIYEGQDRYQVVIPLEHAGWIIMALANWGRISKEKRLHRECEPAGLPAREATVWQLSRAPGKKNIFLPDNAPEKEDFYFLDVEGRVRYGLLRSTALD